MAPHPKKDASPAYGDGLSGNNTMREDAIRFIREKMAKLLGVDVENLDENETRNALRRSTMRTENKRIHEAREDVKKTKGT
jgi:hypothetical protein